MKNNIASILALTSLAFGLSAMAGHPLKSEPLRDYGSPDGPDEEASPLSKSLSGVKRRLMNCCASFMFKGASTRNIGHSPHEPRKLC